MPIKDPTLALRVEVRPSEGGDDAEAFADELVDALTRHAQRLGCQTLTQPSEARTRVLEVRGKESRSLTELAGTHRVQRIPSTDKTGRRHTSSVTVVMLETGSRPDVSLRDRDLDVLRYRGSGPGGQHRNKVSSAVRVRHLPSGLEVSMEHGRSQHQNLTWAKEELGRRLEALAQSRHARGVNSTRVGQLDTGAAKTFTHNEQRDEVVDHERGRRWTRKAFARGLG